MAADQPQAPQNVAQAITDVSERLALLVREEIELAKAEVTQKGLRLAKAAAAGAIVGIFAVVGLLFLLNSLALGIGEIVGSTWAGYLILAIVLFVLGGVLGFIVLRVTKFNSPPVPTMAIEEARKIRQTVSSSNG